MKRIVLPGTDLQVSVLGYGCASFGSQLGDREKLRLLHAAFDAGITHFDTARVYGLGEAERVLGRFLTGRRDQVTVTTKVGLAPPPRSTWLTAARAVARRVVGTSPWLRRQVRRGADALISGGRFSVADARASLETSLRELNTQFVDILLLHECRVHDISEELLESLNACVRTGMARYVGVATDPATTADLLSRGHWFPTVIQIPRSFIEPTLGALPGGHGRATITHSVLARDLAPLWTYVTASPARTRRWSEALQADCSNRDVLATLLLQQVVMANPQGGVLFSSRRPERVRGNAEAVARSRSAPEQMAALARLIAELRAASPANE
ncbi:MAG: aldo/keto reductase [Armatimonadetes bacterium]|nr:aldo/keto reductase [Armatimonadota bacterium]